ncbi:MAG: hypothetical protein ACT4OO_14765 [Nitrospiraceae bacterium]
MRHLAWGLLTTTLLATAQAWGEGITINQGADGTTGTVYDFGSIRTCQDNRNTIGTMDVFGGLSTYRFSNPHGGTQSGTIYTFGAPSPPNNLTPAPILPFTSNSPLMPREQVAPVVPFKPGISTSPSTGAGTFGGSGSGRFGR